MLDPDAINQYFTTIATDNSHCIQDVVSYCVLLTRNIQICVLYGIIKLSGCCDHYELRLDLMIFQLNSTQLKFITTLWLVDQVAQLILVLGIKQMFFGLAGIVTRILNRSFTTGAVPRQ